MATITKATLRNMTYDGLVADVRQTIDAFMSRETTNVKANQKVAWDILCYRELQIADKVKPASWQSLHEGGKALSSWRTQMRTTFLGSPPSMRGDKDQAKIDLSNDYKAKARIFDDAAMFCIAIGLRGVKAEAFNEEASCFAVPGISLVPIDKKWTADYALAGHIKSGKPVLLDNRAYMVRYVDPDDSDKNSTRDIRASLAHVLRVYRQKPPTPGASKQDDGNPGPGSTLDPVVVKAVLKNAGIERLALALRDSFNADPKLPMTREHFDNDVWGALMSVAQRVMHMAQAADEAETAVAQRLRAMHTAEANAAKPKPAPTVADKPAAAA